MAFDLESALATSPYPHKLTEAAVLMAEGRYVEASSLLEETIELRRAGAGDEAQRLVEMQAKRNVALAQLASWAQTLNGVVPPFSGLGDRKMLEDLVDQMRRTIIARGVQNQLRRWIEGPERKGHR